MSMSTEVVKPTMATDEEQRLREKLKRRQESRRASVSNPNSSGLPDGGRNSSENGDSSGPDRRLGDSKRARREEPPRRSPEETGGRNGYHPREERYPAHPRRYDDRPHPPDHWRGGGPRGWAGRGGRGGGRGWERSAGNRGPPPPHWRGPPGPPPPRGRYPPPPPGHYHGRRGRSRSRSRSFSSRSRSHSSSEDSRSRSRSHSSRSYSSRSSRSPSPDPRRRRSRSYDSRSSRSFSDEDDRSISSHSPTPEPRDEETEAADSLTKDQRTVFVSQLVMRATEAELRRYFRKKVGCKVNEIIMLRDKRTGQHKGCAYVELRAVPDVQRALAVSGAAPDFQKFPVQIKASEAEKNYVVPTQSLTASMMGQKANTSPLIDKEGQPYESQKVYLGNLDPRVTNEQLFQLFSSFGTLSKVQIQSEPQTGVSRGFAFLSFRDPKDAHLAIEIMSGQLLAGRAIKTGWASQPSSTAGVQVRTTEEMPPDATRKIQKAHNVLFQLTGAGLTGTAAASVQSGGNGGSKASTSTTSPVASVPTTISTVTVTPAASAVAVDAKSIGRAHDPSEYLLIHNMFNKDEETDPDWEEDIRLDFEEECSKYGKLLKVVVMSKEPGGKIYARFSAINEAKTCASNLAGRWFDKRQLRVEFVDELPDGV